MADRYIHVRYGDSPDAEFVALVDEDLPLQDTLPKHLQTAIERNYIPDTFSPDAYSLLRDGRRIDLRQILARELERNGHSDAPWTVVDDRAPQLLQVAARVDGVKGARSHVLTKTITPSRLATLSEAINPSELFAGSQFSGRVPKRWRVRAVWPGKFWLPWGRWKRQVKDLNRNQLVEVGPSLREWRCYRRALIRIASGLGMALLLALLTPWVGCRRVLIEPSQVRAKVLIGSKVSDLPVNREVPKWVQRWNTVTVLRNGLPLVESRSSRIRLASAPDTTIRVTVSCYEMDGNVQCPGQKLLLNRFVAGDLDGEPIGLDLGPGRYEFELSGGQPWDMVIEGTKGVAASREVWNGRNMLRLFVPPDSTSTSKEATISIYCKCSEPAAARGPR